MSVVVVPGKRGEEKQGIVGGGVWGGGLQINTDMEGKGLGVPYMVFPLGNRRLDIFCAGVEGFMVRL